MPISSEPKVVPEQVYDKYFLSQFHIISDKDGKSSVIIEVMPYRVSEEGVQIFALVPPISLLIPDLFKDQDIITDPEVAGSVLQTQAYLFESVGKVLAKKGLI